MAWLSGVGSASVLRVRGTGAEGLSFIARRGKVGRVCELRGKNLLWLALSLLSSILHAHGRARLALGVVERARERVIWSVPLDPQALVKE